MKIFSLMTEERSHLQNESHPASNWNAIFHIKFWDQGKKEYFLHKYTKCIGLWYGMAVGFVIWGLFFILVLWYFFVTFFLLIGWIFWGGLCVFSFS